MGSTTLLLALGALCILSKSSLANANDENNREIDCAAVLREAAALRRASNVSLRFYS